MPESLYRYIWMIGRRRQLFVVLLTLLVFPLAMVPLEIQRRIIDEAIRDGDLQLLMTLGGTMLGFLLLRGSLKFMMNMQRARATQEATSPCERPPVGGPVS